MIVIDIDLTRDCERVVSDVITQDGYRIVTVGDAGFSFVIRMIEKVSDNIAGQMLDKATGGD